MTTVSKKITALLCALLLLPLAMLSLAGCDSTQPQTTTTDTSSAADASASSAASTSASTPTSSTTSASASTSDASVQFAGKPIISEQTVSASDGTEQYTGSNLCTNGDSSSYDPSSNCVIYNGDVRFVSDEGSTLTFDVYDASATQLLTGGYINIVANGHDVSNGDHVFTLQTPVNVSTGVLRIHIILPQPLPYNTEGSNLIFPNQGNQNQGGSPDASDMASMSYVSGVTLS